MRRCSGFLGRHRPLVVLALSFSPIKGRVLRREEKVCVGKEEVKGLCALAAGVEGEGLC